MAQTPLMLEQSISWWRGNMAGSLTIDNINGKVISSSPVATESQVIGVGQSYQNLTGSRVIGTTYTNSSGKAIGVYIVGTSASPYNLTLTVNGTAVPQAGYGSGGVNTGGNWIVPQGATYTLSGITSLASWHEFR